MCSRPPPSWAPVISPMIIDSCTLLSAWRRCRAWLFLQSRQLHDRLSKASAGRSFLHCILTFFHRHLYSMYLSLVPFAILDGKRGVQLTPLYCCTRRWRRACMRSFIREWHLTTVPTFFVSTILIARYGGICLTDASDTHPSSQPETTPQYSF
jgi:hypothetical protein